MKTLQDMIGLDPNTILWWQMIIRGILVFFYTLLLVRWSGKRIFGKNTSFDIVLAVILGSIMSRTLTANADLLPTFAAAALVALHRLLAKLSQHSQSVAWLIKGDELLLIENGRLNHHNLAKANITPHDLEEAMRLHGGETKFGDVKAAYLERSGASA